MKTPENPIMEYLHTILDRTDQVVEEVSDLRHRMAKLEQVILEKNPKTPVYGRGDSQRVAGHSPEL